MKETLRGKTALITGASSGMGADFARQFAALGCSLILVARRQDRLRDLQTEISKEYGLPVDCVAMDLAEEDAPQQLYTQLKQTGRTVDVLVNNAGLGAYGDFWEVPWEQLRLMLEVNVLALTQLTRLFAADMVERHFGYILLTASNGAFQPTPTYAAYAASKSYVLSLGEALHYELRGSGVKCTVLCPGVTRTEFFDMSGQQMNLFQRSTAMESANVVRIGIKALLKGRSCVVVGGLNAFIAWGTRLLPRQVLAALAARLMH